jgi:hypothetical protein
MDKNSTALNTPQLLTKWLFCATLLLSLFSFAGVGTAGNSVAKPDQEQLIASNTKRKQTIVYSTTQRLPVSISWPHHASAIHLHRVEVVRFLYSPNTIPVYQSKRLTLKFAPRGSIDHSSILKG